MSKFVGADIKRAWWVWYKPSRQLNLLRVKGNAELMTDTPISTYNTIFN
jgi:hypothetical protein